MVLATKGCNDEDYARFEMIGIVQQDKFEYICLSGLLCVKLMMKRGACLGVFFLYKCSINSHMLGVFVPTTPRAQSRRNRGHAPLQNHVVRVSCPRGSANRNCSMSEAIS